VLIIQHVMMGPTNTQACASCTMWANGFNAQLDYIKLRANFAICTKAEPTNLRSFTNSMNWNCQCVSSISNTFSSDFKCENGDCSGYKDGQQPVILVFVKGEDETLYLTYSTFSRGLDTTNLVHSLLDLTPNGRQGMSEGLHSAFGNEHKTDFYPTPYYGANSLGSCCYCLNVKDLIVAKEFYEKLGFVVFSGDVKFNFLVLGNGSSRIGIFQGHIPQNTLTFNPGWSQNGKPLHCGSPFIDVRDLEKKFESAGIVFKEENKISEEARNKTGPAYFMLMDPDNNPLLFDQHV